MGVIEILAGLAGLLALVAGVLFQAWRGERRAKKSAQDWAEAVTETLDHAKRTQAASDKARAEGEKSVESARESAQAGRRDHFEGQ